MAFNLAANAQIFPDIRTSDDYYDAVVYSQQNGIVSGFSDGTFKPNNRITRGEFTKIVVNIATFNEAEFTTVDANCVFSNFEDNGVTKIVYGFLLGAFSDVPNYEFDSSVGESGNIFAYDICAAKSVGILNGFSDGTFKSDNTITNEEAFKIISNAVALTDTSGNENGYEFEPFVQALANRNAIPEFVGAAGDPISRAAVVEIIYRLKADIQNKPSLSFNGFRSGQGVVVTTNPLATNSPAPTPAPTTLPANDTLNDSTSSNQTTQSLSVGNNDVFVVGGTNYVFWTNESIDANCRNGSRTSHNLAVYISGNASQVAEVALNCNTNGEFDGNARVNLGGGFVEVERVMVNSSGKQIFEIIIPN